MNLAGNLIAFWQLCVWTKFSHLGQKSLFKFVKNKDHGDKVTKLYIRRCNTGWLHYDVHAYTWCLANNPPATDNT